MSIGIWVMIIGPLVTFPFAYAYGRKMTKFMDDSDPEMKILYEFQCILIGLMGAVMWPIAWVAYIVKKITERGNDG